MGEVWTCETFTPGNSLFHSILADKRVFLTPRACLFSKLKSLPSMFLAMYKTWCTDNYLLSNFVLRLYLMAVIKFTLLLCS